jgi:hypothetical protein
MGLLGTRRVDPLHQSPRTRAYGFFTSGTVPTSLVLTHLVSLLFPTIFAGCLQNNALLSAHYEPLRHPIRPDLTLASCRLIASAITAGASRVAPDPLCLHVVATTPAARGNEIAHYCSLVVGLPQISGGSAYSCIIGFEACSAFTRVTTYTLAKSPYATLYTGGSGGFVTSTAAPIATEWSDPVPGRAFLPAVDQRLFTAH